MRVTFRPTIAADLPHCIDRPLPYRIKAITALAGDHVLGIGGLGFQPNDVVIAFAIILPEAKRYAAAIHRAGLAAMAMIRAAGVPVVIAETEEDNPAAERWLLRLGFRREESGDDGVYTWRRAADDR